MTAVQTVDVDSRFRGNDDVRRARREYRHSRESGNPPPGCPLVSESQLSRIRGLPLNVFLGKFSSLHLEPVRRSCARCFRMAPGLRFI